MIKVDRDDDRYCLTMALLTRYYSMQYHYLIMPEEERGYFNCLGVEPLTFTAQSFDDVAAIRDNWDKLIRAGYIIGSEEAFIFTDQFLGIQGDHSRMQVNTSDLEKRAITLNAYRRFTQKVASKRIVADLVSP